MSAKNQAQDNADDLDDLDDVLEEFNKGPSSSSANNAAATSSSSSTNTKAADSDSASQPPNLPKGAQPASLEGMADDEDLLSEEFASKFAESMQELLKDLSSGMDQAQLNAALGADKSAAGAAAGPSGSKAAGEEDAKEMNEEELMKQFEKMLFAGASTQSEGPGGAAAASAGASTPKGAGATGPDGKPANFQEAIAASMARLKASDASASDKAQSSSSNDPMAAMLSALAAGGDPNNPEAAAGLEELLKSLGGGEGGAGLDSEEGLAKMLENMMEELMSKDILYEPLKDMRDKFPDYFASDAYKQKGSEDQERFKKQHELVTQIVAGFEDPAWVADESKLAAGSEEAKKQKERRAKIQDLMNKMQDLGSPPDEIVGELPPELDSIAGLGKGPDGEDCTIM